MHLFAVRATLAALFLPNSPHRQFVGWRSWKGIESCLRRADPHLSDVPAALKDAGFTLEALILETPGSLHWGAERVARNECLTAVDDRFPGQWRNLPVPPAFLRLGPASPSRLVALFGSARLSRSSDAWPSTFSSRGYGWVGSVAGLEPDLVVGTASERLDLGELWLARTIPCTLSRPFLEMCASEAVLISELAEEDHEICRAAFEVLRRRLVPVFVDSPATARAKALISLGARLASSPISLIA